MTEGGSAEAELTNVDAHFSTGEKSLGAPPDILHTFGSALNETSEGDTGKRKREPITWKGEGKKGGTEKQSASQASSPKRLRPNPAFLTGLVSGMTRTNQRLLAETATNAACQEITAAAGNGAKAQFDRIPQDQPAKFRKLALSVAAQVNFSSCVAILKEVAAHYGFELAVDGDDGMEPLADRQAANGSTHESAGKKEEEEEWLDGDDDPLAPVRQPKQMTVRLTEHPPEEPLQHRKRSLPVSKARPKPSLPQIALNNRLAGTALSALAGLNMRKGLPRNSQVLAMGAARPTKPVLSVDDTFGVDQDASTEVSPAEASGNPGEEAVEYYEEGSVASELLDSYAEGNEDGEEDLQVPLGRFGGLRVDRGMTVAHTAGRLRGPGLLGPGGMDSHSALLMTGGSDVGATLLAGRGGPLKKAPAAARLSSPQKPKRRNGLFGAAMDGLGK